MKTVVMGLVLSAIGGLGLAAPASSVAQPVQVQSVMPVSIDSDASLEYFIAAASRLVKGETSKDLVAMASRLETLNVQKSVLQRSILEKESEIAGKQVASATQAEKAARAQRDAQKAELAKVDFAIRDLMAEIERRRAQVQREQDEIRAADSALRRFSDSLAGAQRQQTAIATATSSMDAYARRLSTVRKQGTENQVRAALGQLAEARRLRLSSVPPIGPTPR